MKRYGKHVKPGDVVEVTIAYGEKFCFPGNDLFVTVISSYYDNVYDQKWLTVISLEFNKMFLWVKDPYNVIRQTTKKR